MSTPATDAVRSHHVVVVGGGFGGLPAARFLGHEGAQVTLLDRRNHHLFQPLLYQVATGMLSPGQVAPPLRHILRHEPTVTVELAEVEGFDLERRVVLARRPTDERQFEVSYDSLIVAAGAGQSYFGHDEFARFAPGMKTIDDAHELRRRIFGAFEMAESATDEDDRAAWLRMVVVGAGPTGVELSGQIRELATGTLRSEFRRIDPAKVRVVLVDAGTEPLATFGDRLAESSASLLRLLGVELMMSSRVVGVDADGVDVQRGDDVVRIAARTVVWAAGVEASPLATALAAATGAQTDRAGRIEVLPDLTLPGHPEVFAVGDMVSLDGLPGVAEVAMQGGLHAANTIVRRRRGEQAAKFRYRDVGSVATIGRFRAVVSYRGIRLRGFAGWLVWMFVHLAFLNGFANRVATLWSWVRTMVWTARSERVVSVAHTGGDLSTPDAVRREVQPNPFPEMGTGPSADS